MLSCDGCGDRRDRDAIADWGAAILFVLIVVLSITLAWMTLACKTPDCVGQQTMMGLWRIGYAVTLFFAVIVLVLRLRRATVDLTATLLTWIALGILALPAAHGLPAWVRWLAGG